MEGQSRQLPAYDWTATKIIVGSVVHAAELDSLVPQHVLFNHL